jgi:hypothetical protein
MDAAIRAATVSGGLALPLGRGGAGQESKAVQAGARKKVKQLRESVEEATAPAAEKA